jgi:hypothetical protein
MKAVISALEEVPEALRGEYVQKDGKFVLKLEGDEFPGYIKASDLAEANAKLAEFRDNNRSLMSQVEDFKKKYEGVDPSEYKTLKDKIAEFERKGVRGGDDVAARIQKGIEEAVAPLQKQLLDLTEREQKAKHDLARKELESVLTQEGMNAGISEKALPDYIRRGLEVWHYENGKPVARDGEKPLYSPKKPTEPLSPKEWITGLAVEAPHLFKSSSGGGAAGGAGGGGDQLTYDSKDPKDFLANLDKIAKGAMVPRET